MIEHLSLHIEPLVTPVGCETEFALAPDRPERRLPERSYEITILSKVSREAACVSGNWGEDGRVHFRYGSDIAGECIVSVAYPGGQWRRMGSIYVVPTSLAGRLPLQGDMHIHTWYSDGRASPLDMVLRGRELGMDFLAITDHDKWEASAEARDAAAGLGTPPIVLLGEEVSFNRGHIVAVNGRQSVAAKRVNPGYQAERDEILSELAQRQLHDNLPAALYDDAVWAARAARGVGALTYLAHPFWVADDQFHVDRRVATQLLLDHEVDGIELIGDVEFEDNLLSVSWYQQLLAQGMDVPVVGNSDTHGQLHTFGRHWTIAFAREYSQEGVLEALRSGNTVACTRAEGEDVRIYGSLPLVEYAYFCQRAFLSQKARLCLQASPSVAGRELSDTVAGLYQRSFGHL